MAGYILDYSKANDDGAGTSEGTAWKNFHVALSRLDPGDSLACRGGTTHLVTRDTQYTVMASGTSGSHIVVKNYQDETASFQFVPHGSDATRTSNPYAGFVFLDPAGRAYIDFIANAPGRLSFGGQHLYTNGFAGNAGFYFSNAGSNIRLDGVEIKDMRGAGILGAGAADCLVENCWLWSNGNVSTQDHGIYASGPNLIIRNNLIYDNIAWGVHIYDDNYTGRQVYNNRIWGNGGDGVLMSRGGGTIHDNVIFDNGQHGISLWRTVDATVYHNTIYSNDWWGISDGTDGRIATRSLIKGNIAIGNVLGDCKTFSTSANAVIQWNTFGTASITSLSASDTVSDNVYNAVATTEWVDPTNATPASKDFNLKAGAGSIDPSGMPSLGITSDIAGNVRPQGSSVDKGAYEYASDPPDGPGVTHDPTYVVTTEYGAITVTLVKGTNNIVECTLQGTGAAALCVDNTDVTVVRVV